GHRSPAGEGPDRAFDGPVDLGSPGDRDLGERPAGARVSHVEPLAAVGSQRAPGAWRGGEHSGDLMRGRRRLYDPRPMKILLTYGPLSAASLDEIRAAAPAAEVRYEPAKG